jgi:alkylation response protein AidB-like acyl-CoA dehydrogenase
VPAVVDGPDADYAAVLARSSDEPGERGLQLVLVDHAGSEVVADAQK